MGERLEVTIGLDRDVTLRLDDGREVRLHNLGMHRNPHYGVMIGIEAPRDIAVRREELEAKGGAA